MIVRLEDPNGSDIIVNTDHVIFALQQKEPGGAPVLGRSLVYMFGIPQPLCVVGSPTEIYGLLRRGEWGADKDNHREARN